MIILGVECTAHTFGVGLVTNQGKVLANVRDSYSSPDKGMIPHEIAGHHHQVAEEVLKEALETANLTWDEIEFIAYSAGPGLDPALWAGYHIVKEWGKKYNKKLIGINHCCSHLSIGKIYSKLKDPCYLYVSGVNTQIIVWEGGKYRVVGETLDIGLGNMLDKFGRVLNLGFPAGAKIEELAKKGRYVELPYVVKGMDVSFSGILTRVQQLWEKKPTWKELLKQQGKNPESYIFDSATGNKEDLCFSLQETCFAMCTEVAERAMAHTEKEELLLIGGVGANKRFCEMLEIMCQEREAKFYKVPLDLTADNGAMIAWEGFLRREESGDIGVKPHWRTDEV